MQARLDAVQPLGRHCDGSKAASLATSAVKALAGYAIPFTAEVSTICLVLRLEFSAGDHNPLQALVTFTAILEKHSSPKYRHDFATLLQGNLLDHI